MLPNYEVFHSLQSIIEINMFKNCKSLFDLISVFSLYRRHYFRILYCFCFYCYTCIIKSFILLFILYYFSNTSIPQHHDSKGKLILESQDFFFGITSFICLLRRFCIKLKNTYISFMITCKKYLYFQ